MKRFILIICMCAIGWNAEVFQLIQIDSPGQSTMDELLSLGISPTDIRIFPDGHLDFPLPSGKYPILEASGIEHQIIHTDLAVYLGSRLTGNFTREFGFGSMGGYYTWEEMVNRMFELGMEYPDLVSDIVDLGNSLEGRPIFAFALSDNPNLEEDEPEILYTGLHHAREPMSMMNQFYYINWLLENYGVDPLATYILNHRKLWFIPCVNPDGYDYNYHQYPDGGGMHRKNLTPVCEEGNLGVDLNRNYGYMWGYDNIGSSNNPCEDTYRGPDPFSELETQHLAQFISEHNFSITLNYHTYQNLVLTPLSYDYNAGMDEGDQEIFDEYARELARYNHYTPGNGAYAIYPTNGDSDDWLYGDQGIYAFTVEIGNYDDYFWAPTDRIVPLAEEVLYSNQFAAQAAGAAYRAEFTTEFDEFSAGHYYLVDILLYNQGLSASEGTVELEIFHDGPGGVVMIGPASVENLESRTSVSLPGLFEFHIPENTPSGTILEFELKMTDAAGYSYSQTHQVTVGIWETIFSDDAENGMINWTTDSWGITDDSYSGESAFADSPHGEYAPGVATFMVLSDPIDLSNAVAASFSFDVQWDTYLRFDFASCFASTTNDLFGEDWLWLQGQEMLGLSSVFGPDYPEYFGYRGSGRWVRDSMNLENFLGEEQVFLLWQLVSPTTMGPPYNGVTLDNLEINIIRSDFLPGDINLDLVVDVLDVIRLVNIIMGEIPTPEEFQAGDANADGILDVLDIIQLVQLIIAP